MRPLDPFLPDLLHLSRALSPYGETPRLAAVHIAGNNVLAELAWDVRLLLPIAVLSIR
jgi:hypothetical protein